jgi:hypothetical protein
MNTYLTIMVTILVLTQMDFSQTPRSIKYGNLSPPYPTEAGERMCKV